MSVAISSKRTPRPGWAGRTAIGKTGAIRIAVALSAAAFTTGGASAAQAMDPIAAKAEIDALLVSAYPGLEALYEDVHRHPELAFQETRTAAHLAARMRELGFEVTEKVGGTGVVAVYRNGPGPVVLVRTELDALPVEERTGLSYASQARSLWREPAGVVVLRDPARNSVGAAASAPTDMPVSHVCGHDSHMAAWVGTAQALLHLKREWSGTLVFVAQPAEETLSGARAMLADGLYTRFPKPDFIFAAHVGPMPAGEVDLKAGPALAAADNLTLTLWGRGGHGAAPSATIDPIVIGAHFVSDVQAVVSREKDPNLLGVVTVGSFQGGSAGNIISDHADLKLTLRAAAPQVRARLLGGVVRTAKAAADMAGAGAPTLVETSGAAPVVNDPSLATRAAETMRKAFGEKFTLRPAGDPPIASSDDFSELAAGGAYAAYFSIGGADAKMIEAYRAQGRSIPINHAPDFHVAPEPAIKTGVEVLSLAVLTVAEREQSDPRHPPVAAGH